MVKFLLERFFVYSNGLFQFNWDSGPLTVGTKSKWSVNVRHERGFVTHNDPELVSNYWWQLALSHCLLLCISLCTMYRTSYEQAKSLPTFSATLVNASHWRDYLGFGRFMSGTDAWNITDNFVVSIATIDSYGQQYFTSFHPLLTISS